jgi:Domain of unknown function (DUF4397)
VTAWFHRRISVIILSFCFAAALSACGGGSSDAKVRFVNGALDYGAFDVYFDDKLKNVGVAQGTTSGYMDFEVKSKTLKITRTGSTAALIEQTFSPSSDTNYTFVILGNEGSLRMSSFGENESDPAADKGTIRFVNGSADSSSLDVYASTSATSVTDLAIKGTTGGPGSTSSWIELDKGTYKVWLTASGDRSDVRLFLPSVVVGDKKRTNIVLMPTVGGTLVNAQLLQQKEAASAVNNTFARIRLIAGTSDGARVTVNATGADRLLSNASPSVSSYTQVTAGQTTLSILTNGAAIPSLAADIVAGSDNTLLVYGAIGSVQAKLIADDNRSVTTSGRSKIRLISGYAGSGGGLTLSADYSPLASGVLTGNASPYSLITSGVYSRIDASEAGVSKPVYLTEDFSIAAQSVYSVIVLGTPSAPVGVLRKDR